MRSTWSGSIGFGMVNIPIKLYTAVDKQAVKLSRLCKGCGGQIGYKNVCKGCGKEVEYGDWNKGFEVAKNQFITITQEQIDSIKLPSETTIQITTFVPLRDINVVWLSDAYYVGVDEKKGKVNSGTRKAYAMLRFALEKQKKVAIGTICMRGKESLVAIRSYNGGLLLSKLHYAEQIRDCTEVFSGLETIALTEKEKDVACQLIESMSDKFDYTSYVDRYADALASLIEGKPVATVEQKPVAPTEDVLGQFEASITKVKEKPIEVATP
ncbi:MAG: non-homologous end joining protein Ku [Candidatus Methanospirareceae archaeon]